MFTLLVATIVKAHLVLAPAPAVCSAPRDIGGGQTVRTCEVVRK